MLLSRWDGDAWFFHFFGEGVAVFFREGVDACFNVRGIFCPTRFFVYCFLRVEGIGA